MDAPADTNTNTPAVTNQDDVVVPDKPTAQRPSPFAPGKSESFEITSINPNETLQVQEIESSRETSPVQEMTPTPENSQAETLKPTETITQPPQAPIQEPEKDFVPLESAVSEPEQPAQVVDKTEEPTELHELKDTRDKLTSIADKEEDEFIKKVKAVHESK